MFYASSFLKSSTDGERPPFTSTSDWLEMAGEIWRTIIKFQDIVKFKNLNELQLHKDLKKLVDEMMKTHFYSQKKAFREMVDKSCIEIRDFDSRSDSVSELNEQIERKSKELSDYFEGLRQKCTLEYRSQAADLQDSQLIHKEHLEQLDRLITTEKLDYTISLKSHSNEIYNQKKRMESRWKRLVIITHTRYFGNNFLNRKIWIPYTENKI